MEVILLENIGNLGALGDKVDVKPGYGRNFLIPQGKAVPATADNVSKFEARRAELEAAAAERWLPLKHAEKRLPHWARSRSPRLRAKKANCSVRSARGISPRP